MISPPDASTATASGVHPPHDLIPLIAPARLEPFDDDRTRDAKDARALLEL